MVFQHSAGLRLFDSGPHTQVGAHKPHITPPPHHIVDIPAGRPRRLFDSQLHPARTLTPGHAPHAAGACSMCRMGDLAALSRTGARVPCLKARIPMRLPWTELRSPRLAVHPCAKPMDRALRPPPPSLCLPAQCPWTALRPPPAWLCVHARVPCT